MRVLKKGGLLAIAYINKHYVINNIVTKDSSYISQAFVNKILYEGVTKEGESECFWTDAFFTSPVEIETIIAEFDAEIIDHVATDGISPMLKDAIDNLNEEQYDAWIHYHLKSCRDRSIMGISNHGLVLCRKK